MFVWGNALFVQALAFVEIKRDGMVDKARYGNGSLFVYCITSKHPSWKSFFQHRVAGGVTPAGACRLFAKSALPCLVEPGIPGLIVVQITWPNGPDGEPLLSIVDEEDFSESVDNDSS